MPGFMPGNKLGTGRPKGAKNQLPIIRDRVFNILSKRLVQKEEVGKISTEALLKFASGCLPKDMTLSLNKPPEINYISMVPRPEIAQTIDAKTVTENDAVQRSVESDQIIQPIDANVVIDNAVTQVVVAQ